MKVNKFMNKRKVGILSDSEKAEIRKMAKVNVDSYVNAPSYDRKKYYNFFSKCFPFGCLEKEDIYKLSKIDSDDAVDFLEDILSQEYFYKEYEGFEIFTYIFNSSNNRLLQNSIFRKVLTQRRWAQDKRVFELLSELASRKSNHYKLVELLSHSEYARQDQTIDLLLGLIKSSSDRDVLNPLLLGIKDSDWADHERSIEIFREIIKSGKVSNFSYFIDHKDDKWMKGPHGAEILEGIIDNKRDHYSVVRSLANEY